MGQINAGDILRVTCKMHANNVGQDIQNVFHYKHYGDSATDTAWFTACATLMDTAYDALKTQIPNDVTFESIAVWDITQDRPVYEGSWPTLTAGTATADPLPSQTAALALFTSDKARSQGRKYLPPFAENACDTNGKLTSGATAALVTWIADVLLYVAAVNWHSVPGNWSPTKVRFAQWLAGLAQDYFRTQRRRVEGVGS